jgi:hypothetical protein
MLVPKVWKFVRALKQLSNIMDSDFDNYVRSRKKRLQIVPNFVTIYGKPVFSYIHYGGRPIVQ